MLSYFGWKVHLWFTLQSRQFQMFLFGIIPPPLKIFSVTFSLVLIMFQSHISFLSTIQWKWILSDVRPNYQFPILLHHSLNLPKHSDFVSSKNKNQSSDICQFQFCNTFPLYRIKWRVKNGFPYNHVYHIILHTDKLILISSLFDIIINTVVTYMFMLIKKCYFCFSDLTYDSLHYLFFSILDFFTFHSYNFSITIH